MYKNGRSRNKSPDLFGLLEIISYFKNLLRQNAAQREQSNRILKELNTCLLQFQLPAQPNANGSLKYLKKTA